MLGQNEKLLLIFDLDGTLIDSSQDLAISTNATRAHFGLPPLDDALINSYVGNGAAVLVTKAMGTGLPEGQLDEALRFFLAYYRAHSLEHTKLYHGIAGALDALTSAGHTLGVLTNKPEKISRDILTGLGVARAFFRIYGGNTLARKKPDPIGILTLSHEAGISLAETWMIGDSSVDVQTAQNAGVRCCGVAWGFQPQTFVEWPPDLLLRTPGELAAILRHTPTPAQFS